MTVSGTNDRYLRSDVALRVAYEKMEPYLVALDFVRPVPESDGKFMYIYNDTSKSGDSKKKQPVGYTQGGAFPEIDFSRPSTAAALMESNGFSVRLPRNVIRQDAGKNEIMRCYENAGFWLAEWLNTKILAAMTSGATTPTWTPTATWDSTSATPVEDLRLLKYQMRREGYPYRLTDVLVNVDNLSELEAYLTAMDISAVKQERIYGMPGGNGDSIYVPVAGCTVTGLDSGITEGYALACDKGNPACEYHYYVDPKFGTARITYTTMQDGKKTQKTVPNMGVHFKSFEEDDTHDTIMQFWVEGKPVVINAYGLLYDNGI